MGFYYFPYSGLINAVTSFTLGFFVLSKNYRSPTNRRYAFFAFSVSFWAINYFLWLMSKETLQALFYIRSAMIGAILIAPSFTYFTITLLNQKRKLLNLVNFALAGVFVCLSFSSIYIQRVEPRLFFPFWPVPGYLFHLMLFYWISNLIYAHLNLWKRMKESHGIQRIQIKYVFIGILVGFIGGSPNYFLWYNIRIPPYSNILVSGFVICVAYAIIRHQLMDIEVIIKKTLIYSILISIITILYFIIVYLLERIFSIVAGYQSIPITIAIIALFSIIFIPLKNKIQRSIDKYFFKGTIDQIEREKHLLETELERSERLKTVSSLAAGMAHEIKNPLTSIKTFVEYIDKKYHDPEFKRKFKSIVPTEIDKISSIINQLLDYSKVDRINLKECNIRHILDYTLDLYNNEFIRKNIKLEKTYNSKSPNITCDENQIKQAFINIVLNSIEAMPNGGKLTVQTKDINNTLEISIQDTGKGIPKENLKNLFNPFYTTKEKGTGLGLFIVHQIIENNKGKIIVDSEPNKGTIVKVGFVKG